VKEKIKFGHAENERLDARGPHLQLALPVL